MNDWRTWRNTKINSSTCIPADDLSFRKTPRRKSKTVSFLCQNNQEALIEMDSSPRRLSLSFSVSKK